MCAAVEVLSGKSWHIRWT